LLPLRALLHAPATPPTFRGPRLPQSSPSGFLTHYAGPRCNILTFLCSSLALVARPHSDATPSGSFPLAMSQTLTRLPSPACSYTHSFLVTDFVCHLGSESRRYLCSVARDYVYLGILSYRTLLNEPMTCSDYISRLPHAPHVHWEAMRGVQPSQLTWVSELPPGLANDDPPRVSSTGSDECAAVSFSNAVGPATAGVVLGTRMTSRCHTSIAATRHASGITGSPHCPPPAPAPLRPSQVRTTLASPHDPRKSARRQRVHARHRHAPSRTPFKHAPRRMTPRHGRAMKGAEVRLVQSATPAPVVLHGRCPAASPAAHGFVRQRASGSDREDCGLAWR